MAYTKRNEARYIAHLDLTRVFDRALRRAGVEVAYSEGFNPHPKISFGPPLPVGVEGQREYVDIDLKTMDHNQEVSSRESEQEASLEALQIAFLKKTVEKLQEQLPEGITLMDYGVRPQGDKALMAVINLARYQTRVPFLGPVETNTILEACQRWLAREEVIGARIQKGKKMERNIRPFVSRIAVLSQEDPHQAMMQFDIVTGNAGSVRPIEVLESLHMLEALPVDIPGVYTSREGVYIEEADGTLRDLIG